jgi:TRAP transporter TAXI family solute receptor
MSDSVIQAIEAFGAYEGKEPAADLRVMMGLWPNICQIVTTADSGIKTFEDMKGRRVGVGAPNSGVELNARMMFEAHGMTYDDCKVDYLSYGEAIDQMKNGQCDVAFVTSGLGNATIKSWAPPRRSSSCRWRANRCSGSSRSTRFTSSPRSPRTSMRRPRTPRPPPS